MKKIIFILMAIAIISAALISCSDRRDGDPIAPPALGVKFTVIDGTDSYENIKIKGSFNEWALVPLNKNGNVWTVVLNDIPAGDYEWGAIEDDGSEWGIWLIEGPNPTFTVDENGVGQATYEIPVPAGTVNVTLNVDMNAVDPISADGVHVAGSFQGWNPGGTELTDPDADGIYSITLEMEMGATEQFKFLNGNAWGAGIQEVVPAEYGVDDQNGGYNRELVVPNEDASFTYVFSGAPVE